MKKVALICVVALALSTAAMASDIAFYVGQWNTDGWYDESQFDDVETIIAQTGVLFKDIQQFGDDQFDAFGAWVDENTDDGELDIIWLNGCTPSVLYPNPNQEPDGSRAETWLDNGNMIINVGDWFAYCTYEGGSRGADNAGTGAANILDLSSAIIAGGGQGVMEVTAAGSEYLPSLNAVTSDRPVQLSSVVAPWEVAAVFAQNSGGTYADPVVLHNTETGGYLAIINQGAGGNWIDDRGLTCAEFIANWVNNVVGLADPSLAADPSPEDGAVDVPPDAVLVWASGMTAETHDVYFGTSFEDVNTASRSNPLGVLVSENQTANTYDPEGVLEFGVTYYWRIDEVNGAPDNTIFKGETWSFTAEPFAYPIENIIATSNATSEDTAGPQNTVNGSGLNELDQHSTASGDMWLGVPGADPVYIQYEFDQVYKLHELLVWNYNVQFELILGFGLKDVTIDYSTDGVEWMTLGDAVFAQATAQSTYEANTTVDLGGVPAKYVRITVNSGYGMMGQYGLSEVRFMYIPASAREPEPADGAANVSVNTDLAWRAGRDATSHEVSFGTDPAALPVVDTVTGTSYTPGALDLATTYYWQLTAVQETESWTAAVWDFATQEYLVVDDFESYDDEDNRIYDSWLDGWVNETGSTVGYLEEPFAEQSITHSG
ncbi:MAG: discoidin domain-containing protein, partial [Phycisphaerales bacterium]